jgi:hypothetical protein
MSTAVFYSLSIVCQYITMHRLLVLYHYVHCCLLQSVQSTSMSLPRTRQHVFSLSVTHNPYADRRLTVGYPTAVRPFTSGFGGAEVACWPLIPKFAGSKPDEAVGFLKGDKNPQHAFLRKGSKIIGPMSQICVM